MSLARRIAKNAVLLSVSNVLSQLVYLVLIIAVTRFMGDSGFGRFSFAVSFTSVFLFVADMGLSVLSTREVSRRHSLAPKYMGALLLLKAFISLATFALIFFLSLLLDKPLETKVAIWILALYIILRSYRVVFVSIFRAFERMEYEAVAIFLDRFIITVLGLLMLYSGHGLIMLAWSFPVAAIIVDIYLWRSISKARISPVLRIDLRFWKKLLLNSWPLALSNSFTLLYYQIGVILIGLWLSDAAVGWYNAALQLSSSIVFIPRMFSLAVFPSFSSLYVSSKSTLKRVLFLSLKLMAALALAIAVATTVLGKLFISIIYSPDFLPGLLPLRILTWALVFIFTNQIFLNFLNATNRENFVLLVSGGSLALNALLSIILIPLIGFAGAAFALLISSLAGFVAYSGYVFKNFFTLNYIKIFAGPFMASVLMGILLFLLKNISLLILVPLGAVSYFVFLFLVRGVSPDEMKIVKEILSGALSGEFKTKT
ncbi:flippase [Candidatus Woesearchaeota archaeon]|nr:MAG: flippase [Candidatus Woesearchaeota archaeon]